MTVGVEAEDGMVQIIDGLSPGERVVVSGQFLLDSEASVRESLARMVQGQPAGQQQPMVETASGSAGQVSPQVQERIDTLAAAYLAIQDQLTRDALGDIEVQLASLREASMHLGHLASGEVLTLAEAVREASDFAVDNLDAVREAFGPLSDATIALLKAVPPSPAATDGAADATIYVTHCPMVGKDWLQIGDQIRNPYATYMLKCGSVVEGLGQPANNPAEGDDDR